MGVNNSFQLNIDYTCILWLQTDCQAIEMASAKFNSLMLFGLNHAHEMTHNILPFTTKKIHIKLLRAALPGRTQENLMKRIRNVNTWVASNWPNAFGAFRFCAVNELLLDFFCYSTKIFHIFLFNVSISCHLAHFRLFFFATIHTDSLIIFVVCYIWWQKKEGISLAFNTIFRMCALSIAQTPKR